MFVGYNVEDYRQRSRKVLPRGLFEFLDNGTEDNVAVARNREIFDSIKLTPRLMRNVSQRSTACSLLGHDWSMPVAVGPTGAAGLLWYNGEIALARAAKRAGVPFTLATGSLTSIERIADEAGGNLWFQLYIWPDISLSHALIKRAKDADYQALVVTIDVPVPANREHNQRNGFTVPFRLNKRNFLDIASHPGWLLRVLGKYVTTTGLPLYENYPTEIKARFTSQPVGRAMLKSDTIEWPDIAGIRKLWDRPLIIKGILHPDDAEQAIRHGADAIVVSNHGGRVLDSVVSSMEVLQAIAERVAGRVPVFIDSGFRRGSDIVKALAMGANGVLLGRSTLYGIAANGEEGAHRILTLIGEEVVRVMGTIGCPLMKDLSDEYLTFTDDRFLKSYMRSSRPGMKIASRARSLKNG